MNALYRWIAFASAPVVLLLKMSATQAFTDGNAELRDVAAARSVVATSAPPAAPPTTAWVPVSVKSLEGFRPVYPGERLAAARARATVVAQAGPSASAPRR
jgi:hypothetical protein